MSSLSSSNLTDKSSRLIGASAAPTLVDDDFKMAVGAYAVLTCVARQAAECHRWVAPRQMLEGLGRAEATSGRFICSRRSSSPV